MSRSRPVQALLLLLVAAGLTNLWLLARASAGIDFYQMWAGPRIAREVQDFYAPAVRDRMGEEYLRRAVIEEPSSRRVAVARFRRRLETVSTPSLYLLYVPFLGSYEHDLLLFQLLMFASFLLWLAFVARLSGHGRIASLALLAFLVLSFEPVRSDTRVVNMNHAILLMLAAAAYCVTRGRPASAGALLATATLIKPYVILTLPLLCLLWLVQRRQRESIRLAAGAAAATVIGIAASSLYFRSTTIWLEWLSAFRAMPSSMIAPATGNFALCELIRLTTGWHLTPLLLLLPIVIAAIAFRRAAASPAHDRLAIWLGCVVFQFGSPLVWVHHLLLSVPLAIHLLRPADEAEINGLQPSPVTPDSRSGSAGPSSRRVAVCQYVAAGALALLAIEPWGRFATSVTEVTVMVNLALMALFVAGLRDLTAVENEAARPATSAVP